MFVRPLLLLALTGSLAYAGETAKKPKVAFRVVKIMPESHQALLFDKIKGTHVLAEVGGKVGELTVEDIEDDEVTLEADGGAQIVLTAPEQGKKRHKKHDAKAEAAKTDAKPEAAPVDPYAPAASDKAGDQPEDPYADPAVRTAEAPHAIDAGEGGVRTAEAPDAPATPTPPAATPAPTAPPAATPAPTPTTPAAPATPGPTILTRAQITAALSDFSKLASGVRGAFTKDGVRIDVVAAGSLFANAGLVAGDVVTSVDDKPLVSIDDAATLYARASTAKAYKVQLVRAGKPLTIRIAIQ